MFTDIENPFYEKKKEEKSWLVLYVTGTYDSYSSPGK